jgi:hypothetical protein
MRPATGCHQYPRLVNQLSEIDLATTSPSTAHSSHHDQVVIEQDFYVQVMPATIVHVWRQQQCHYEIELSLAQTRQIQRRSIDLVHVQDDTRIQPGKAFKDWWQYRGNCFGAPNLHLACCGIGQELDVPDALLQFIEYRSTASEQRATVHRRLNTVRTSIEQPHTERLLKIGDRFRNGGLGNSKMLSRLGHAAALSGREKCVQVPQLEPAADLTLPVDFSWHRHFL